MKRRIEPAAGAGPTGPPAGSTIPRQGFPSSTGLVAVATKPSLAVRNQMNSAAILIYQDKDTSLSLGYWGKPCGNNVRRNPLFAKLVEGRINLLEFEPHEVGGEGARPRSSSSAPAIAPRPSG